jgi:hypothetical protein
MSCAAAICVVALRNEIGIETYTKVSINEAYPLLTPLSSRERALTRKRKTIAAASSMMTLMRKRVSEARMLLAVAVASPDTTSAPV